MATVETTTSRRKVPTWQVVVYTFLGFILIAALALIFRKSLNGPVVADQKVVQERLTKLAAVRKEALETTTTYSWADKGAGVVRIPVDQAMALTLKELQGKSVQKSNVPLNPVVPAAAPAAPAAATTPAAATAAGAKK